MSEIGKASVWFSKQTGAMFSVAPLFEGVVKVRLEEADDFDFDINIDDDQAAWLAAALLHAIEKKESASE